MQFSIFEGIDVIPFIPFFWKFVISNSPLKLSQSLRYGWL